MGTIISSKKKDDNNIVFEVAVNSEEALQLRGHVENVHIFSTNACDLKTRVAGRGKNEATKYFLIPLDYRKDLNFNGPIHCQKIDTKDSAILVYTVEKK